MTKLTESGLLRAYDLSSPPDAATDMEATPAPIFVSAPLVRAGDRTCKRGHMVKGGGKCIACQKLNDRSRSKTRKSLRSRCDRGHILSADNVVMSSCTRKDGRVVKQRNCRTCLSRRDERKSEQRQHSSRFTRARARATVDEINDYILRRVPEIELMTTFELAKWNEERVDLVKQKDALNRLHNFG